MTISTTTSRTELACNGSNKEFTTDFKVFATSEVEVVLRTISTGVDSVLTSGVDYNIVLAGTAPSVCTITTIAETAYSSNYRIILYRSVAQTQDTDLTNNDSLPSSIIEERLDKLTLQIQDLQAQLDRSLKIPIGDASSLITDISNSVDRANKYLHFGADGSASVSDSVMPSTAVVGTFGATLIANTTQADACADLADTTATLGTSDTKIPSQKAVKAYVDTQLLTGSVSMSNKTLVTPTISGTVTLASPIITAAKLNTSIDNTGTAIETSLAGSATKFATASAIKTYIDAAIAANTPKYWAYTSTRDLGDVSGAESFTIGWRPKMLICHAYRMYAVSRWKEWSYGMFDGTTARTGFYYTNYTSLTDNGDYQNWGDTTGYVIEIYVGILSSVGQYQIASPAFTSDGFTLNWTKSGSSTGTIHINYIAMG